MNVLESFEKTKQECITLFLEKYCFFADNKHDFDSYCQSHGIANPRTEISAIHIAECWFMEKKYMPNFIAMLNYLQGIEKIINEAVKKSNEVRT